MSQAVRRQKRSFNRLRKPNQEEHGGNEARPYASGNDVETWPPAKKMVEEKPKGKKDGSKSEPRCYLLGNAGHPGPLGQKREYYVVKPCLKGETAGEGGIPGEAPRRDYPKRREEHEAQEHEAYSENQVPFQSLKL